MKVPKILLKNQNGQILITLVIVIPALTLIVGSYLSLSSSAYRLQRSDQFRTQAQMAVDAGADYAVGQINQDSSWAGITETTLQTDSTKRTTYAVTVASNSASSKTLTVTGRTYFPSTAAAPSASVTVKVDLQAISQGSYSIVSGVGGLIMSNSSKIVAGDIYINGTISMSNTAQIGLSTNFVNVNVANEACPLSGGPTYPRLCNLGENNNPISINNSARIYGDVKANHQFSGAGMSNPGLTASSGVAAQPLPVHDRPAQKAAVAVTIPGNFSCSNGNQTWAANTKIMGNATISGNCKVTVQGNVWITGDLSLTNTSQMIVAASMGSTRPIIMVDGAGGANFRNSSQLVSNTDGTGFMIYTFWNSTGNPDTNVTGTDLFNSRNTVTINLQNSASAPQTVFYAYWSRVQISNTGAIGALIGQSVELKNNGTITFGTSVPTGGSTYWLVNGYRRSF